MEKIFVEENGRYCIDCTNALWATAQMNMEYHKAGIHISDIDFVMENVTHIFLVEYKICIVNTADISCYYLIKSACMNQCRNRCTLCLLYDEKKNDTGGRHMEQYAYIRVSTKEQNIDRQLLALEQYHIPPRDIVGDKK